MFCRRVVVLFPFLPVGGEIFEQLTGSGYAIGRRGSCCRDEEAIGIIYAAFGGVCVHCSGVRFASCFTGTNGHSGKRCSGGSAHPCCTSVARFCGVSASVHTRSPSAMSEPGYL